MYAKTFNYHPNLQPISLFLSRYLNFFLTGGVKHVAV